MLLHGRRVRLPPWLATEREIHELAGKLRAAANAWAAGDGSFDEAEATRLRHARSRCATRTTGPPLPAYRRLCDEAGVGDDAPLAVLAERCTVTDDLFKSYDAAWVGTRDFAALSGWLRDVCAEPVPADAAAARDIDDWLERLERGGLHVLYSSGTSGKLSFVPRGEASWEAYRANGPSYLMHAHRLGMDLSTGRCRPGVPRRAHGHPARRSGVLALLADVHYLYDREIRAEVLRVLLTARSAAAAERLGAALGMGQDEAYRDFLGALRRATERGRAVWLFGAPHQVKALCALMQAVGAPPLRPGSVVTLGGGWKSFEGERVDRPALCAMIEAALGVPPARVLEAYAMVELNSPLDALRRRALPRAADPGAVAVRRGAPAAAPGADVTGTFGFMDPTATSYPAFVVTGDEVRLVRERCPCGLVGPAIVGEVRRAPGHEVRGCGGVLATVRA